MEWIGLTGGIATGKSTVAQVLKAQGCVVVDADQLARQAVAKNSEGFKQVVKTFGTKVLNSEGDLDRSRLGKLVFSDPNYREKLEKIIHPIVRHLALAEKARLESQGVERAFYDVPLLFEKNLESLFDQVLLVYAPEKLQIERMRARDGFSEPEARKRLAAQVPIEEKRSRATQVIDNSGSLEELEAQVVGYLMVPGSETGTHRS